jgi:signal transduction histidine kinase
MAASSGGEISPGVEKISIRYKNQEMGLLVVAPRSPGEILSQGDKQLLENIAQLVATTIRTLQLNEQLQQSRRQLVTAREEERRRIRRDLHDGLGPVLASLTLQADTAMDLVRNDPDEAVALLQKILTKAQKSVIDIRHLVYGLRPPALDELGLEGAIHQFISSLGPGDLSFTVEMSGNLSALPAAVEVATYRIAQEAVNNVVSHSRATSCIVRLTLDDELCLEITDNGTGLPDDRRMGIGLQSMRDRAAELGGTCGIQTTLSGGTRVFARLPLNEAKE